MARKDAPCKLVAIPPLRRAEAVGEWLCASDGAARSDGGRWPGVTWATNPQFALCAAATGRALIVADDVSAAPKPPAGQRRQQPQPFDPSRVIGVRVMHPATRVSSDAEGSLRVASGMSGSVRDPASGALREVQRHTSLDLPELELEEFGIRGRRTQAPASKPRAARNPAAAAATAAELAAAEGRLADAMAAAASVTRAIVSQPELTVAEFGYASELQACGVLELQGQTPLLAVPSLASAGVGGRFRLSVLCDAPVALQAVTRRAQTFLIDGAWKGGKGGSAGGCHLEPTWGANPQYGVTVFCDPSDDEGGECSLTITLRRPEEPWSTLLQSRPVESMAGFYLLRAGDEPRRLGLKNKSSLDIVHESCFAPTLEASCTLTVPASVTSTTLVLIPATYGAGQAGPFTVELACDSNVHIEELKP